MNSNEGTAALDRYLADNPGQSVRDYKGKGFDKRNPFDKHLVLPGEQPWDRLDPIEVRRVATTDKARFLSRAERQAAARDPSLVWDERSRSYRLRRDASPAPSPADLGSVEGVGGIESKCVSPASTGRSPDFNKSDRFSKENTHG